MVVGAELYQSGVWARQAIERLSQDGLPPTARNYAVYYTYVSGQNPTLSCAFDWAVSSGKMMQFLCDELYDKHIVPDSEEAFLRNANTALDGELKKVMGLLVQSTEGTDQFGKNLDNFSGTLSKTTSVETLREAVAKIAAETHVIAAQNDKLREDLADTTMELSEMRSDFDRVHRESEIDPLTEVGNRKYFNREILRVMTEAREQKTLLSLLMVDIDHFKKFNDTHGHLIGDQVLRLVARTLVENLKGRDIIARYGGEEFVIMLPLTRLQDAERVANQLRMGLSSKQIARRGTNEILGSATISIGVAEYVENEDPDMLLARADAALYRAKQTGRNKVVCAVTEDGAM